jgi:tetrahydromethanopterin S-methyltransferase subunit E
MVDNLTDLWGFFISFVALSMTIGCIIVWIMLIINKKEEESFDEKYRRTRKHNGYKPGR